MNKEDKKVLNLTLRVSPSMYEALHNYTLSLGVSTSEFIRQLIGRELNIDHSLKKIPCVLQDRTSKHLH